MINVVNKYKHTPTENDYYIARGSCLGNIFTHIKNKETKAEFIVETREEAITNYEKWLNKKIEDGDENICKALNEIYLMTKKGDVNLVCYCAPKSCHGDIIKKLIESKL